MTATLYLIRHGETAFNRDGKGLGRSDVPLTATGETQARLTGAAFAGVALDRVLVSPLSRAMRVAEAVGAHSGSSVEVRESLIELDVGLTEGAAYADTAAQFPEFMRQWAGPGAADALFPGGESLRDVAGRVSPLGGEFRGLPGGSALAVVSHNFVLRALLCVLLDAPLENFRSFQIDLASVTTVTVRNGRVAVSRLNDTCHLDSLNLGETARSV